MKLNKKNLLLFLHFSQHLERSGIYSTLYFKMRYGGRAKANCAPLAWPNASEWVREWVCQYISPEIASFQKGENKKRGKELFSFGVLSFSFSSSCWSGVFYPSQRHGQSVFLKNGFQNITSQIDWSEIKIVVPWESCNFGYRTRNFFTLVGNSCMDWRVGYLSTGSPSFSFQFFFDKSSGCTFLNFSWHASLSVWLVVCLSSLSVCIFLRTDSGKSTKPDWRIIKYFTSVRDYQSSCCCDIFLTFSFLGRFLM